MTLSYQTQHGLCDNDYLSHTCVKCFLCGVKVVKGVKVVNGVKVVKVVNGVKGVKVVNGVKRLKVVKGVSGVKGILCHFAHRRQFNL